MRSGAAELASMRIAVLLATYNGAHYLDEQLASIDRQRAGTIDVWVSDDGSSDGTRDKLAEWAARWTRGAFTVVNGPRRGFSENFRSLVAREGVPADLYAFSDQDDVWDEDKLARAAEWIAGGMEDRPRLWCSRTRLVDEQGRVLGLSPLFGKRPSFRNALVQSLAGGNTMVVNHTAMQLLRECARRAPFVSHDWWAYQIVSGADGLIHYDPDPSISYRQHGLNAIGSNRSLVSRLVRIREVLRGRFRSWNAINLAGLETCSDMLSDEARRTLRDFAAARRGPAPARLRALRRSGVHRQTTAAHYSLYLACLIGRL